MRLAMCPRCADSVPLDIRGRLVSHPSPMRPRLVCPASGWRPVAYGREQRRIEVAQVNRYVKVHPGTRINGRVLSRSWILPVVDRIEIGQWVGLIVVYTPQGDRWLLSTADVEVLPKACEVES